MQHPTAVAMPCNALQYKPFMDKVQVFPKKLYKNGNKNQLFAISNYKKVNTFYPFDMPNY